MASLLPAALLLGQAVAFGQAASPAPSALPSPPPVDLLGRGTGGTAQVVIYFLLIVALLAAGLVLTRGGGLRFRPAGGKIARKLVISETRSLGGRQYLVVAEYEEKKMLLGVCPGRIDYLSTLAGGDESFDLKEKDE